jgi:hypothetical protein
MVAVTIGVSVAASRLPTTVNNEYVFFPAWVYLLMYFLNVLSCSWPLLIIFRDGNFQWWVLGLVCFPWWAMGIPRKLVVAGEKFAFHGLCGELNSFTLSDVARVELVETTGLDSIRSIGCCGKSKMLRFYYTDAFISAEDEKIAERKAQKKCFVCREGSAPKYIDVGVEGWHQCKQAGLLADLSLGTVDEFGVEGTTP